MEAQGGNRCQECGAVLPASGDCWTRLHELLEIELRVLPALEPEHGKRAHFFAVSTYQLQHPSRLTPESLGFLRTAVGTMIGPTPPPVAQLRRRVSRLADGPQKVGRSGPPGDRSHVDGRWPRTWSVTANDVAQLPDRQYPGAVRQWAATTLAEIDAALADDPE